MPVSKESLLKVEGHDRKQEQQRNPVTTQLSSMSSDHQYDINPMRMQQRRHNEAVHDPVPAMQPSHTMRVTDNNTLLIFHSADGGAGHRDMRYYTEIPFAAIHGMQTRPRDGSQTFQGSSTRLDSDPGIPSITTKSFVDEFQSGGAVTWPLLIATMANSLSQFQVGYNIAILNTTERYIFPNHTTLSWSWAVAALAIGAPFGAMIGGRLSDSFGRKWALVFNSIGFVVGGLLQAMAPSLEMLTLARFLLGLESGVATVLVPIYLGELAPPHLRGTLGTVNQFAFVVGILVADLLSFPLANDYGWRYLLGMVPILALVQLMLMPWVVESPRFLLHLNPRDARAKDIMKRLRGYTSTEDVEEEMDVYVAVATALCTPRTPRRTFDIEKPASTTKKIPTLQVEPDSILWEMLTFPGIRFVFFCGVFLHIGQQLCGVAAVFYYSTSLFEEIIDNPLLGTTSIGAVNVLFTYVALLLMDSYQRKSLVLCSIVGMLLSCSGLILCQTGVIHSNAVPALIFVNSYVAFYAIGYGPIPFLWIAEMVEPRYVALAMTICSQINWIVNFLVGLLFPLMKETLGGLAFVPFGVALFLSFFFVWKVLPENRQPGTPNAENQEEIGRRNIV